MTVAYFVVLEEANPGFHTYVSGNAVAKAASNIDRIARMLKIPTLEEFVNADLAEFFDDDEEDFHDTTAEVHKVWFDAAVGLDWATRISDYIDKNPDDVHDSDAVKSDLAEYQELFENAAKAGIRWHLEVDF